MLAIVPRRSAVRIGNPCNAPYLRARRRFIDLFMVSPLLRRWLTIRDGALALGDPRRAAIGRQRAAAEKPSLCRTEQCRALRQNPGDVRELVDPPEPLDQLRGGTRSQHPRDQLARLGVDLCVAERRIGAALARGRLMRGALAVDPPDLADRGPRLLECHVDA